MSRHIVKFVSPLETQQVFDSFLQYWRNEGFEACVQDGEECMKKGVGLATAPQFVKINSINGVYVLQAWIKFPILPGIFLGEMDLDGFFGSIPKGMLKSRVNYFFTLVQAQQTM